VRKCDKPTTGSAGVPPATERAARIERCLPRGDNVRCSPRTVLLIFESVSNSIRAARSVAGGTPALPVVGLLHFLAGWCS
jgi:hypothetical protein